MPPITNRPSSNDPPSNSVTRMLAGAPLTAVGAAVIRAAESARADHLYNDPWAQRFVDAAGGEIGDSPAAQQRWGAMLALAEAMQEGRTIGMRQVDDTLLQWIDGGNRQIVLFGSGLDSHAFRLPWPGAARLFEVDLPELFEFKEAVLNGVAPHPACERRVVRADAAADWVSALLAAEYQPALPTLWVDHVTPFLPTDAAWRAVRAITDLSTSNSRLEIPVMSKPSLVASLRSTPDAARLLSGDPTARGLGEDIAATLHELGWSLAFRPFAEVAAGYGRSVSYPGEDQSGTVIARRD